ncbi:hypothetical protein DITRI_Ditri03aG0104000 [Diplodiscus trichospermus]
MGRQPHVLVLPFPGQGHIVPIMKLALQIAGHGVKVTFVNTEFIHAKMMICLPEKAEERSLINFVSIPDGLEMEDDRADLVKLTESVHRTMPAYLEDLILKIKQSNVDEQITCVIADTAVGWAHEMAKKLGIEAVAFWPSAGACLALALHIPKLLEAGLINTDGTFMTDEPISLAKDLPSWTSSEIEDDPEIQKLVFEFCSFVSKYAKFHDWILCNSNHELEPAALQLIPNILPVGPLLSSNYLSTFVGNLWPEDPTCLEWLDKQPSGSVIYVAFGSTTNLNSQQVEELALGLELTGQQFLWVVPSDFIPDGFIDRVAERAKFVQWAPQEKVLAHPAIACFISHCGWNSMLEGLGVPFLCWPYFADQLYNKKYICDVWKVGLGFTEDENGIINRHEIRTKVKTVLSSDVIKANALHMKDVAGKCWDEGGSSFNNLQKFIEHIKSL